ncbi:MAG TPA: hypothetical protein VJT13_14310 [Xanthobacteraceae bacterium]|nr:hypothetical protein [Xanthobacteraceae bacterium]
MTGTVEELRTQVADTATDIKERLSPEAIKTEVTQYVRDSRDQLWNSLERKARDNPLQAVAVGAALAYPALKLMRAMPAPLLLVGAGLLLSRTSGGSDSGAADALRNHAQSALDSAGETFEQATDGARRKIHDAQDYARQGADAAIERASDMAASIADRVTGAASDATAAMRDTADKVKGQAEELVQQTRETVSETWDKNPLLVAAIGLGIGAFIAAAFPSTKAEESVFGEASDALRRQADVVATKGVEAARSAVEGIAAAASGEGLSVDGLNQFGENLTGKVRAVAERGVEAALGETKTNAPETDAPSAGQTNRSPGKKEVTT